MNICFLNFVTNNQPYQIHKIVRCISKEKIPYLEFYKLASNREPFFTQYYRTEGDPIVCGHEDKDCHENHCAMCGVDIWEFVSVYGFMKIAFMHRLNN